jgi:hypothetical protein
MPWKQASGTGRTESIIFLFHAFVSFLILMWNIPDVHRSRIVIGYLCPLQGWPDKARVIPV